MPTRYKICCRILGAKSELEIDEQLFEEIRISRDSLFLLFQIEEDYDILIGNYLDLEKTILSIGWESFIYSRRDRSEFDADRRQVDRMLSNLMGSARAFIDHTKKSVSGISGADEVSRVSRFFSKAYDRSLGYRALEAIRNYTQHCGLPTKALWYHRRWEPSPLAEEKKLISNVAPGFSISVLRADKKFKQTVLEELESAKGNEIEIMPLVREYVGGLSYVMDAIRCLYGERQNAWLEVLDQSVSRYRAIAQNDLERKSIGLAAISMDENGKICVEVPLMVEIRERLKNLQAANRHIVNLEKVQIVG